MADSTVAALSAASALTGPELLYGVQSAADKKITATQVKAFINAGLFAGPVVGNWYIPIGCGSIGAGTAPGANSIRLKLVYFPVQITIDTLGLNISTLGAAANVQAAIYAHNPTTGRPTGTALVSTASMSTAATGVVNSAASLQLGPGFYWTATNTDSVGAVFRADSAATFTFMSMFLGSATQLTDLGSSVGLGGLSVAQTFNTWPDLTSASFTELTTSTAVPIVQYKVASVP
jgi:hypothetical protein